MRPVRERLRDHPAGQPRGPLLQWVAGEAARHNEAAFAAPKPERKTL